MKMRQTQHWKEGRVGHDQGMEEWAPIHDMRKKHRCYFFFFFF